MKCPDFCAFTFLFLIVTQMLIRPKSFDIVFFEVKNLTIEMLYFDTDYSLLKKQGQQAIRKLIAWIWGSNVNDFSYNERGRVKWHTLFHIYNKST